MVVPPRGRYREYRTKSGELRDLSPAPEPNVILASLAKALRIASGSDTGLIVRAVINGERRPRRRPWDLGGWRVISAALTRKQQRPHEGTRSDGPEQ